MLAVCLSFLALAEEPLRVKGPPFIAFGETIQVSAESSVRDAVVLWRVADAPGGALAAFETKPALDRRIFTARGVDRLELTSRGGMEGDALLTVSLERNGLRIASVGYRLRIGPLLRVRAWCRVVENPRGGTERPELVRRAALRHGLQEEVNTYLRPLGIEISLEEGVPVKAPDAWFDQDGRFEPVQLKYGGERTKSATLAELFKRDAPGGLNVYFIRDCHLRTVVEGFPRVVTEHSLVGIGMKDGQVVVGDGADAAVLAHEFGHAFSLDDLHDPSERERLMYSIRRERTGALFTFQEMKDARTRALLHHKAQTPRR